MAKSEPELPCLEMLAETPGILRGLMCELSDKDARWKPAPDRFSVAEVLSHLSHTEGHCWRMRVDLMMSKERPVVQGDDAQMHLEQYRDADPEEEFAHFEEQRETNIEFLSSLPQEADERTAVHAEVGEFTLSQMLHSWVLHDLGHIRQIAEIVRARRYLAGAGPFGREFVLKP